MFEDTIALYLIRDMGRKVSLRVGPVKIGTKIMLRTVNY